MLQYDGAHVEPLAPHQYLVSCDNERQVYQVGVSLFHTHLQSTVRVVGVSGTAEAKAGAYPFPKSRSERKQYHG
jgi:hypothetical protein